MKRLSILVGVLAIFGVTLAEPERVSAQGPLIGVQMDKIWAVRADLSDKNSDLGLIAGEFLGLPHNIVFPLTTRGAFVCLELAQTASVASRSNRFQIGGIERGMHPNGRFVTDVVCGIAYNE